MLPLNSDSAFVSFLKKTKGVWKAALCVVVACVLLFAARQSTAGTKTQETVSSDSSESYTAALEAHVADVCSSVRGVGKCRIMITLERGEEKLYQGSTVRTSTPPRVQAVTVICEGADSDEVRRNLTVMLSSMFDIGTNRVCILRLKK